MNEIKKHQKIKNLCIVTGITVTGMLILPTILKSVTNKAYKNGRKTTEEDFIDNAPEMVRKVGNCETRSASSQS